jgi:hypothetical protein
MTDAVLSINVSPDQLDVALRTNDTGWQWGQLNLESLGKLDA